MRKGLFIAALACLLGICSCKSQYDIVLASGSVEEKMKMAFELYDTEKYSKAAEMFESLSLLTDGTPQEDTVKYYWGMSNFKYGDYTTAEANFAEFIMTFPFSPFSEDAQYTRMLCLYNNTYRYELDQRPTHTALSVMEQFQKENPGSIHHDEVARMQDELNDRLELKAYKSAYLYYHMEDYLAAHYALKNVLKDNADNRYREEVLYYTALSAYKYAANSIESKQRERYLTFVDDYLNIVSEYPESKYIDELESLYNKTQKILKNKQDNE